MVLCQIGDEILVQVSIFYRKNAISRPFFFFSNSEKTGNITRYRSNIMPNIIKIHWMVLLLLLN